MTVSSAPREATSSPTPCARFSRTNAFRVLSLPADAEPKAIDWQQRRILVAIEMGGLEGTKPYGLPPLRDLSTEEILEAVLLLERPEDRLIEELFWVHEMDGLIEGPPHDVLAVLRGTAAGKTTRSAVARHNLAVMHAALGLECAENCGWEHWKESLKTWKELIDDDLFWTFTKDRASRIDCQNFDLRRMKAAVCRQLSSTFSEEMVRAAKSRELTAVPILARIVMEHRSWLRFEAALRFVGQQSTKEGFSSLGVILDRLSGITRQDTEANIQSLLDGTEEALRDVEGKYGNVVRSLGELADPDGWDDAVASSYQRLSDAYLSLLDDPDQAIRLITYARKLARDPQRLQSIERDSQNVQRAILCRQADALARKGDLSGAEHKLEAALAISTEEGKTEIEVSRELYRRARESMERDRQQVRRATLCWEAYGSVQRGDFAGAERKLADALTISTEEQKPEIKALRARCRWARVLRGVDTTKNNPTLYRFSGVGATFFGRDDYDPATRSYVTNHWLTFLFVPAFPLGAYRVTDADFRSHDIHGRVPLPDLLKKVRWAIVASGIVLVLAVVTGRGTYTKTVGATSTSAIASAQSAGTSDSPEKSVLAAGSEKGDIKQERTPLTVLFQALEDRKRKLGVEDADLHKQERYLASVASAYAEEKVPAGGQSTYEAVFAEYKSRVKKYNTDLSALKADYAAYNERVDSLNARR